MFYGSMNAHSVLGVSDFFTIIYFYCVILRLHNGITVCYKIREQGVIYFLTFLLTFV